MRLLTHKNGLGLPAVLGIVSFVMVLVAGLLVYTVNQVTLVNRVISEQIEQAEAVSALEAMMRIIEDQDIPLDELEALAAALSLTEEVEANAISDVLAHLTFQLSRGRFMSAFISRSGDIIDLYGDLFATTGYTPEMQALNITAARLLIAFLPQYYATHFPAIEVPDDLTTFADIFTFIRNQALNNLSYEYKLPNDITYSGNQANIYGHWYVDGDVSIAINQTLTVHNNHILFIDGNLTMDRNATINGNIVVSGNVTINGRGNSTETLHSTLYVGGSLSANRRVALGTSARPAFIMVQNNISLGNNISGYGYLLCDVFDAAGAGSSSISGGIYYQTSNKDIRSVNSHVIDAELYDDYAIPLVLIESAENGGSVRYTTPRLLSGS